MKKYKLLKNNTIKVEGKTLYRIKALKDFGNVNKGDIGGYVESEYNLSQIVNCWVYGNAKVYDNARVSGNAQVFDDARVYDNAGVFGNARVFDYAHVYNNARVYGDAWVYGNARIFGDARVCDNARVYGNARVFGIARVYGNARVFGDAQVNKKYIYNRIIFSSFEVTWFDKPVILHYYEKEEINE